MWIYTKKSQLFFQLREFFLIFGRDVTEGEGLIFLVLYFRVK
jgi:hypothetical protein